ncbi:Gfo/Idh/MocA family oxidoreductase [Salinibacterium sp. G-O1]|uniref:Gfo/Idh/MocA family protein n=1 Tax=Salinibacterium sp. G-O1 TaxID=3046208 RepID=UPI0024BA8397|nr:Gfo/Idh/MocA family oxidoreductase [Salinibacterium sp. G-O1]MDJ0334172.1 Gfo/Idh/MocA family oxidoreductase [Salinibacterium sp. G-O1]
MTTIAIVGQGYMARTHAASWAKLGFAENIKYIQTPRPGEPLEHAPSATFVTDLDAVLADPEVDVISICSPTDSHPEIAIRALRAGKNVLLEKPIALTISDALKIRDAARDSGAIMMIAQVIRFFKGYQLLRDDVRDGHLGTVLSVRGSRLSNRPDWAKWWHDEERSGGVVVDFSIHDYDQLNLFLGEPVAVSAVSVSTLGPIETTVEYRGGGVGQVLSFADTAQGVPFTSSIEALGTKGMAGYDFAAAAPTAGASGVNVYSRSGVNGSESREIEGDDPYTAQVEYFLDCIRHTRQPGLSTTESAIRALEVSLAARQSIATGRRITIESCVADADAAGTVFAP